MIKSIVSAAAALALAAIATAPAAQPAASPLNLDAATSTAERMVICDTALFLASRPNFTANIMYANRQSTLPDPELLLPPYFIGPDRWFDEDLAIASDRLRGRGEISYGELNAAFDKYAQPVLDGYVHRSSLMTIPSAELSRQARTCSRYARDLRLNRVAG